MSSTPESGEECTDEIDVAMAASDLQLLTSSACFRHGGGGGGGRATASCRGRGGGCGNGTPELLAAPQLELLGATHLCVALVVPSLSLASHVGLAICSVQVRHSTDLQCGQAATQTFAFPTGFLLLQRVHVQRPVMFANQSRLPEHLHIVGDALLVGAGAGKVG